MIRRTAISMGLAGAVAVSALFAQDSYKKTEPPKPGPEVARLEHFVGTWKGEGMMMESPFGPAGKMGWSETCEWFEGKFQVVCRSSGTGPMGPSKGISILSWNAGTKMYDFFGADSTGWHGSAKGTLENGTWSFTSEEQMGDATIKGRYVMKETSPDAHTFQYDMQGPDGGWKKIMEGNARRGK